MHCCIVVTLIPYTLLIYLEFHGNLTGLIVGFYQAEYINSEGEKVPMATSKFQPTDARSAFPCFDEPSYKSTFSTTLVRPSERYVALSNMPEERQVWSSFSKSMSFSFKSLLIKIVIDFRSKTPPDPGLPR